MPTHPSPKSTILNWCELMPPLPLASILRRPAGCLATLTTDPEIEGATDDGRTVTDWSAAQLIRRGRTSDPVTQVGLSLSSVRREIMRRSLRYLVHRRSSHERDTRSRREGRAFLSLTSAYCLLPCVYPHSLAHSLTHPLTLSHSLAGSRRLARRTADSRLQRRSSTTVTLACRHECVLPANTAKTHHQRDSRVRCLLHDADEQSAAAPATDEDSVACSQDRDHLSHEVRTQDEGGCRRWVLRVRRACNREGGRRHPATRQE